MLPGAVDLARQVSESAKLATENVVRFLIPLPRYAYTFRGPEGLVALRFGLAFLLVISSI